MEKKTIFLELPAEIVDEIDRRNMMGDRSAFVSDLLGKQLHGDISIMNVSTEIPTIMKQETKPGEIGLIDSRGQPLGRFNINTVDGFEQLAAKICEISDDPIVRMKARRWR